MRSFRLTYFSICWIIEIFNLLNRSLTWPNIEIIWNKNFYYMAFQNSVFWLVGMRSVKTHTRTVVRIFRFWTGDPDVVYLAGNFAFKQKIFLLFNFPILIKFTDKNFKQVNCFFIQHVCLPYNVSETDDSCWFNSRKKLMLKTQFSHITNRRFLISRSP
jgi:hypothetical protein